MYRVDAFRLGLFFGGFSATYKAVLCGCRHLLGREPEWASIAAGASAGSFVLFLEPVRALRRRHFVMLGLRVCVRVCVCFAWRASDRWLYVCVLLLVICMLPGDSTERRTVHGRSRHSVAVQYRKGAGLVAPLGLSLEPRRHAVRCE